MTKQVAGFQTSQGSLYGYDESGKTVRLKQSSGRGHGEIHTPSVCIFVPPKAMDSIYQHYFGNHEDNRLFLGYCQSGDQSLMAITDVKTVPTEANIYLVIQERATGKTLALGPATLSPQLGWHPVEKAYNSDGTSSTHVGNPVAHLFTSAADLMQATFKALNAQASLATRPTEARQGAAVSPPTVSG